MQYWLDFGEWCIHGKTYLTQAALYSNIFCECCKGEFYLHPVPRDSKKGWTCTRCKE